jgi:hypothetical protein
MLVNPSYMRDIGESITVVQQSWEKSKILYVKINLLPKAKRAGGMNQV